MAMPAMETIIALLGRPAHGADRLTERAGLCEEQDLSL